MSDQLLVFDGAKVDALAEAMDRCAEQVRQMTDESRRIINNRVIGWMADSKSRTAQANFDVRLHGRVEDISQTLNTGAEALRRVADVGRHTESRVVAMID